MALYFPVLNGIESATFLRDDVEGITSNELRPTLEDRIEELNQELNSEGLVPTFGMEIEFQFCINPEVADIAASLGFNDDDDVERYRDRLYTKVLEVACPKWANERHRRFAKGEVTNQILEHTIIDSIDGSNSDRTQEHILEARTAPADALTALERYWNLVSAIAEVAEQNGLLSTICSTHINAALLVEPRNDRQNGFYNIRGFCFPESAPYVAAIQRNLNALYPLQIDAGIEEGLVVNEAFPFNKTSSTVVYDHRLEIRHPSVGIADPRLDMLAVLSGVTDVVKDKVSNATLSQARVCKAITDFKSMDWLANSLGFGLLQAAIDKSSGRFAFPAQPHFIETGTVADDIDRISRILAGDERGVGDDGAYLRSQLTAARRVNGKTIIPDEPKYERLKNLFKDITVLETREAVRVEPYVLYDSPESHLERRRFITQSPLVRRIFGQALGSLVKIQDSVAARSDLIDRTMVKVEYV